MAALRKCPLCTSGAEGLDKFVCEGVCVVYRQEGRFYLGDSKVGKHSDGWAVTHRVNFCTHLFKWLIICVQIQRREYRGGREKRSSAISMRSNSKWTAFLQRITTQQTISQELNSAIRVYLWSTSGCNNVYAGPPCSLLPVLELCAWKNVLSRRNFLTRVWGHSERAYICSDGYVTNTNWVWATIHIAGEGIRFKLCIVFLIARNDGSQTSPSKAVHGFPQSLHLQDIFNRRNPLPPNPEAHAFTIFFFILSLFIPCW